MVGHGAELLPLPFNSLARFLGKLQTKGEQRERKTSSARENEQKAISVRRNRGRIESRTTHCLNANCIRHNNRGTVTLKCVVVVVIGIGNAFDFLLSRTWENWRRGLEHKERRRAKVEVTLNRSIL